MKNFRYIIPAILVITSSCSSQLFTGVTNDDLYYRASDQPVTTVQKNETALASDQQYYDNIFAADTLIADEYVPYEEFSVQETPSAGTSVINNYYGVSPSDQIYLFGNYFYPYWRDPFYYSPFYSGFYVGNYFGYSPYYWDYYDPFYYNSWYNPYYYYGYGGYMPWYYSGYYNPGWYYNDINYNVARRGGYSTTTRNVNGSGNPRNIPAAGFSSSTQGFYGSRRASSASLTKGASATGTSVPSASEGRRTSSTSEASYNRPATQTYNSAAQSQGYGRREVSNPSTQAATQSMNRPQYQTTQRTYTPSYNNPRMSSRPSYNNSRTTTSTSAPSYGTYRSSGSSASGSGSSNSYSQPRQYNSSGSVGSSGPSRSSSSVQYSAPSRVSSGSSSYSGSGGSRSSGGSSYSGGSSHSSGSSSGFSSGSSSSSSQSSSSSSGGGGGGRRH